MCQAHIHIAIYTEKTSIIENNLMTKEIKMYEYISLDSSPRINTDLKPD